MKDMQDMLYEEFTKCDLIPSFYFTSNDFFNQLSDVEERKHIRAKYKQCAGKQYVHFYNKGTLIGFLKLKPNILI